MVTCGRQCRSLEDGCKEPLQSVTCQSALEKRRRQFDVRLADAASRESRWRRRLTRRPSVSTTRSAISRYSGSRARSALENGARGSSVLEQRAARDPRCVRSSCWSTLVCR